MPPLKFILDLDGVVARWDRTANRVLREQFGHVLDEPHPHWDYVAEQIPPEHWKWLWTEGVMPMFMHQEPYPGAVRAAQWLHKRTHLAIVTSRPAEAAEATVNWLDEHGLSYCELHVVSHGAKSDVVREHGPYDVALEDSDANLEDYLSNTRLHVLAWDRPWNRKFTSACRSKRLTVVRSWREVKDWVRANEGRRAA